MISIESLRQLRLGGYAIFDFATAFLGIYLLSPLLSRIFLKLRLDIPRRNWFFLTIPIGILSHIIIGNITPMTQDFLDPGSNYLLKAIILGLLALGLENIKWIKKP